MLIIKPLPSLSNVVAGNKATLNCPVGLTYEKVTFAFSGVTLAQLLNIEVVINGKVVQHYASGTELKALNDDYARPYTAGYLTLYFARPELATVQQQRLTAIGTLDVQTLTIQMDIDGAAAAPAITAHAVLSDPAPLGQIVKVRGFPRTFAVGGKQEIDSLPTAVDGGIMAIHLFKSDITNVEVEMNSVKVRDQAKVLGEAIQTEYGRVPQTALATHVDFCLDGDIHQALRVKGAKDFRVNPTLGTSGAVRVVVEYLDMFGGI